MLADDGEVVKVHTLMDGDQNKLEYMLLTFGTI